MRLPNTQHPPFLNQTATWRCRQQVHLHPRTAPAHAPSKAPLLITRVGAQASSGPDAGGSGSGISSATHSSAPRGHIADSTSRSTIGGSGVGSNIISSSTGGSSMSADGPQTQALSFTNSYGERLSAKFMDGGSDDVIILCHGYAASKDGFLFPRLASELAARGRSSLRFDFAGNGESEGVFSFGNYYREVEDLRSAVVHVRGSMGRRVTAIVGHSKGGNVVLLYASRYGDVPHVVNIAGRGIMSRGIKERFGSDILERLAREGAVEQEVRADGGRRTIKYLLTKESVDERMALDMLAEAAKIGLPPPPPPSSAAASALSPTSPSSCHRCCCHVLTVHGTADAVIPVEDAHALAAALPPGHHTLALVEGADHNFRRPAAAERLLARVTEYLLGVGSGV